MGEQTLFSINEAIVPAGVRRVVEAGIRSVDPQQVILFGSRARGDSRDNSDFDLVFVFPETRRDRWLRFLADLDDAALTLRTLDLVDWNEASDPMRLQISMEGRVLYERKSGC